MFVFKLVRITHYHSRQLSAYIFKVAFILLVIDQKNFVICQFFYLDKNLTSRRGISQQGYKKAAINLVVGGYKV